MSLLVWALFLGAAVRVTPIPDEVALQGIWNHLGVSRIGLSEPPAPRVGEPRSSQLLDAHNRVRYAYKLPPLRYSYALEDQARGWAEWLRDHYHCRAARAPWPDAVIADGPRRVAVPSSFVRSYLAVGQNVARLAAGSTPRDAVATWMQQARHYKYGAVGAKCNVHNETADFTQLVWQSTDSVGCARVKCGATRAADMVRRAADLWVCNYSPAGNIPGARPFSADKRGPLPCCIGSECSDLDKATESTASPQSETETRIQESKAEIGCADVYPAMDCARERWQCASGSAKMRVLCRRTCGFCSVMDLGTLEPTPFSADDGPALHATLPPIAIVDDDDDDDDDVAEAEGVGPQISVHESTDGDETYEWSERGPKEAKADVGYGATEGFNDDEDGGGGGSGGDNDDNTGDGTAVNRRRLELSLAPTVEVTLAPDADAWGAEAGVDEDGGSLSATMAPLNSHSEPVNSQTVDSNSEHRRNQPQRQPPDAEAAAVSPTMLPPNAAEGAGMPAQPGPVDEEGAGVSVEMPAASAVEAGVDRGEAAPLAARMMRRRQRLPATLPPTAAALAAGDVHATRRPSAGVSSNTGPAESATLPPAGRTISDVGPAESATLPPASRAPHTLGMPPSRRLVGDAEEAPATVVGDAEEAPATVVGDAEEAPATVVGDAEGAPATVVGNAEEAPATVVGDAEEAPATVVGDAEEAPATVVGDAEEAPATVVGDAEEAPATVVGDAEEAPATVVGNAEGAPPPFQTVIRNVQRDVHRDVQHDVKRDVQHDVRVQHDVQQEAPMSVRQARVARSDVQRDVQRDVKRDVQRDMQRGVQHDVQRQAPMSAREAGAARSSLLVATPTEVDVAAGLETLPPAAEAPALSQTMSSAGAARLPQRGTVEHSIEDAGSVSHAIRELNTPVIDRMVEVAAATLPPTIGEGKWLTNR